MTNTAEQRVSFKTEDNLELEGAFFKASDNAVLIAHPHPVYGGDMENIVVREIAAIYRARGWSTMRFNFRGTGKSGGSHSGGTAEQKDIKAAAEFLKKKGACRIDMAGYSFGAWVLAHTDTSGLCDGRMVMISPPAAMMDFSKARPCSRLMLAVTGSEDAIAPPGHVRQVISGLNPEAELKVIKGADHFFSNRLVELKASIDELLHI